MRQQINLYDAPEEYNAWRELSPFPQIGMGLVVVLLLLYVLARFEHSDLQDQLTEVEGQFESRQSELDRLKTSLPSAELDPALEREVDELTTDLASKQEMMRTINLKQMDNQKGLSSYLEGLARHTTRGLWLTRIELTGGGTRVGLRGQSARPEFVPQLIRNLAAEDAFRGTEFDVFSLAREENPGYLEFELRASPIEQ